LPPARKASAGTCGEEMRGCKKQGTRSVKEARHEGGARSKARGGCKKQGSEVERTKQGMRRVQEARHEVKRRAWWLKEESWGKVG